MSNITLDEFKKLKEKIQKLENSRAPKGLNQTLLDLRIAVMRTISDIWEDDQLSHSENNGTLLPTVLDNVGYTYFILKFLRENPSVAKTITSDEKKALRSHVNNNLRKFCEEKAISFDYKEGTIILKLSEQEVTTLKARLNLPKVNPSSKDFSDVLREYLSCDRELLQLAFERLSATTESRNLRTIIEASTPEILKKLWKLLYGLNIDYPLFGVQIIKPTARWNLYGDNQWTKPDTEALYVSLPADLPDNGELVPSGIDPHDLIGQLFGTPGNKDAKRAYATSSYLTKYYQSFPSFLGSHNVKERPSSSSEFLILEKEENFPMVNSTLRLTEKDLDFIQVDPHGNDYDLGIAADQFQGFSSMISKLLAALWNNQDARKRLDYGLRLINETDLLMGYHGYKVREFISNACTNNVITSITTEWDKEKRVFRVTSGDHEGLEIKPDSVLKAECSFDSIYDLSYYLNNLKGDDAITLEKFDKRYTQELNATLLKYFHYKSPWIFNLRILVPATEVFFKQADNGNKWKFVADPDHILNLTTIEVPHAPTKEDTSNISLALARYNATGPAYPFTCS